MITVKIDEEDALEMLENRVERWTGDLDEQYLFSKMYEDYVYSGVFDGREFNVMYIVDNDYVNNCEVISEGDEEYELIKSLYEENGPTDCSEESEQYSFIEAEHNGKFLVRY